MVEGGMIGVRILGSLEVTVGGRRVSVGGGKQRLVFAALLLRRGQPVSVDQLVDLVWDERPPANAVKSIQVYVSQLRKELGSDRIVTAGGGYLLRMERGAVDTEAFEDAVARGDAQLVAGDAGRAFATLRDGLALWRGEPLVEFRSEAFAQAEIARLEELRSTAVEQRIEAELILGRHRRLVPELEQLVRDHPLRERLIGQLIVALYRSGRQADALDRYRAGCARLDRELGLEPSPELRSLERSILQHDPALGAEPLRFHRTREPRHLLLAGGVLLVLAAVAAAALVISRGGTAARLRVAPNTVAVIDQSSGRLVAQLPVGGGPVGATGIAAGAGEIWVTVAGNAAAHPVTPPTTVTPLPASTCGRMLTGTASPPTSLIASDLPRLMAGRPSRDVRQMTLAIQLVLAEAHYRAGRFSVGYQACDGSTAVAGDADPARCLSNARAYSGDASLLAEIGPLNSFCAAAQLPITNASPAGPLPTVGVTTTYSGLTQSGPATTVFEPDIYRPTGVPSFLRLVGDDQAQGAADAQLAQQLGLRRIVLLDDGTGTAVADADYLARAAGRLGIRVAGRRSWSARATQFGAVADWVAAAHPDGVYLSGCICANGPTLLRALHARLPHSVVLFAPDNFTSADGEFGLAGPAATGLYVSSSGVPIEQPGPAAAAFAIRFRDAFHQSIHSGEVFAAAQAAQLVLKAIALSDGTRASVLAKLRALRVSSGLLGSYAFDRNGDATAPVFSIYRIGPHPPGPGDGPPFLTIEAEGGLFDRIIQADPRLAAP